MSEKLCIKLYAEEDTDLRKYIESMIDGQITKTIRNNPEYKVNKWFEENKEKLERRLNSVNLDEYIDRFAKNHLTRLRLYNNQELINLLDKKIEKILCEKFSDEILESYINKTLERKIDERIKNLEDYKNLIGEKNG